MRKEEEEEEEEEDEAERSERRRKTIAISFGKAVIVNNGAEDYSTVCFVEK